MGQAGLVTRASQYLATEVPRYVVGDRRPPPRSFPG